jgi:hypothetical protein
VFVFVVCVFKKSWCEGTRGKATPKKKAAGWREEEGAIFLKKKGEKEHQKLLLLLASQLLFSRRGVRFIILHQTREDIRNTHTHTHTHTHTRARAPAHALKTRKESLLKTIVIRREDVSREEE